MQRIFLPLQYWVLALLFTLTVVIGCELKVDPECNGQSFHEYAMSRTNLTDSGNLDFYAMVFHALESGDIKSAKYLMQDSGYNSGIMDGGSLTKVGLDSLKSGKIWYLLYRIADSEGGLTYKDRNALLLQAYMASLSTDSLCVSTLLEIEQDYLRAISEFSYEVDTSKANQLKKHFSPIGNFGRPEFLWAKLHLHKGDDAEARKILFGLLRMGRFGREIYEIFVDYHLAINPDSSQYYLGKLFEEFPNECTPSGLKLLLARNDIDNFLRMYDLCVNSLSLNDSIAAKVYMIQYLLESGKLYDAKILLDSYFKGADVVSLEQIKKWEWGQYFKFKVWLLIAEEKVFEVCEFVERYGHRSENINFGNENEFKSYINQFYQKLWPSKSSEFESWYTLNVKDEYAKVFFPGKSI